MALRAFGCEGLYFAARCECRIANREIDLKILQKILVAVVVLVATSLRRRLSATALSSVAQCESVWDGTGGAVLRGARKEQ